MFIYYYIFSCLFRAIVKPDTGDVTAECLILEPVSFILNIIRNHSFGWHTEQPEMHISGELAAVKVSDIILTNIIVLKLFHKYTQIFAMRTKSVNHILKEKSTISMESIYVC